MPTPSEHFDLAIIGAGFAGLAAARLAHERKLKFCLIAPGFGASAHFSGAFDLVDSRWQNPGPSSLTELPLTDVLAAFTRAHPEHLYAKLASGRADFARNLPAALKAFLDFFEISYRGDGVHPVVAFGSSGQIKPAAFALTPHGLTAPEMKSPAKALVLEFPGLTEYPAAALLKNLSRHFAQVKVLTCRELPFIRLAPLAGLLQKFDDAETVAVLIDFLKPRLGEARFLILPPVLGRTHYLENVSQLESALNVRVVELLSVFPATAGLRLTDHLKRVVAEKNWPWIAGEVAEVFADDAEIKSVRVVSGGAVRQIAARQFLLATGKFLGGGIRHAGRFFEPLFNLPLTAGGEALSSRTSVTALINPEGLKKQRFLDVGVMTDASLRPVFATKPVFHNLKACGHVLSGFDFARDRCGFGVSVASAHACFQ